MTKSFKRICTLTGRNIKEIIRDPLSLIFMLLVPLLMLIMFYAIFHTLTDQFEMKYLAPGIVAFAQTFLTLFAGILISGDRNSSFLTRLYVSKAKSHEFILGYTLSLLPLSLAQAVIFMLVGGILDRSFWSLRMLLTVLVSLVSAILFIGFGILFGSLCNEKSVGGIASIVICGQSVLSGMWFPIEGMSDTVIRVMNVLPFRNASQLLIHITSGYGDFATDILRPLLIVAAYAIVVYLLAILVYNRKMRER